MQTFSIREHRHTRTHRTLKCMDENRSKKIPETKQLLAIFMTFHVLGCFLFQGVVYRIPYTTAHKTIVQSVPGPWRK